MKRSPCIGIALYSFLFFFFLAGQGLADTAAAKEPSDGALQDDWVRLEPGARPAYVGIQGGTAPASLLRATDGSLFVFTGNTGNDFTQVLNTDGSRNGTRLSPDAGEQSLSAEAEDLRPFGLSNPNGVPAASLAAAPPAVPPIDAAAFKPLRLKSYKSLLSYTGSL